MKGKNVLVVEDEDTVRHVLCRLLSTAGFTVHSAESPRTALADAKTYGRLDLLVTNVILPGLNGKGLADAMSRGNPGMKTLLISGYPEEAFAGSGILSKGDNFLQKPFTSIGLEEMVRRLFSKETAVCAGAHAAEKGARI